MYLFSFRLLVTKRFHVLIQNNENKEIYPFTSNRFYLPCNNMSIQKPKNSVKLDGENL